MESGICFIRAQWNLRSPTDQRNLAVLTGRPCSGVFQIRKALNEFLLGSKLIGRSRSYERDGRKAKFD